MSNFNIDIYIHDSGERLDGAPDFDLILNGHIKGISLFNDTWDGTDFLDEAVEARIPLMKDDLLQLRALLNRIPLD